MSAFGGKADIAYDCDIGSQSHNPRKKTSAPNTALATIASHKARGVA